MTDAYGYLYDVIEDEDRDPVEFGSAVMGILMEHPLNSRTYGSAVGAKIGAILCGVDCHPRSALALAIKEVIYASATAAIHRLAIRYGWSEEQLEDAEDELFLRRRTRICMECARTVIPVRCWFCAECESKLDEMDTLEPARG